MLFVLAGQTSCSLHKRSGSSRSEDLPLCSLRTLLASRQKREKIPPIIDDEDNVIASLTVSVYMMFVSLETSPFGAASGLVAEPRSEAGEGPRSRSSWEAVSFSLLTLMSESHHYCKVWVRGDRLLTVWLSWGPSPERHPSPFTGSMRSPEPGLDLIGRRAERLSICHHLGDALSAWHAPSLTPSSGFEAITKLCVRLRYGEKNGTDEGKEGFGGGRQGFWVNLLKVQMFSDFQEDLLRTQY